MIIDNLKEFIAKFTGAHQENNDCVEENSELEEELVGDPISEEETEEEEIIEPLCGIPELDPDIDIEDVYGPRIPDEEVNKPKPCVYGPPSWHINKSLVNKPQPKVYGSKPDDHQ